MPRSSVIVSTANEVGGGGGGGGSLPLDPDGAWYESLALTGLSDGDDVTAWADESANSHDLSSAEASHPVYKASVTPTGAPIVRSAGAERFVGSSAFYDDGSVPFTLFMVASHANTGGTSQVAVWMGGNEMNWAETGGSKFARFDPGPAVISPNAVDGSFVVYTAVFSPSSRAELYEGKTLVASETAPASALSNASLGLNLLADAAFGGSAYTTMDLAAVLIYFSALGDTDREGVVDYLDGRYVTP